MPPAEWQVRLSAAARRDFTEIIRWTSRRFGADQARRYGDAINKVLGELSAGPELAGSRSREEFGPHVRVVVVARQGRRARHLLVYRVTSGSRLDVTRILHDAMEMARHIPGGGGT